MSEFTREDLSKLVRPAKDSHKGENGRVLVIGGSKLFHASIFWSADVASKIVDLVHFTSSANENNEVVRKRIKGGFWNGIVVDWGEVESYIKEDDVVIIGPGMPRKEGLMEGERSTEEIVNELLGKFPDKKWVVDGGALQECDPTKLTENMIITPHWGELKRLVEKLGLIEIKTRLEEMQNRADEEIREERGKILSDLSQRLGGVTILSKSVEDIVCRRDECVLIVGGNEGLTKGGTGDVLAGLVGGMLARNEPMVAAGSSSFVLKKAADRLYESVGVYYNSSDLVEEIAKELGRK